MSDPNTIMLPPRPWSKLLLTAGLFCLLGPPLGLLFGVAYLSLFALVGSDMGLAEAWTVTWAATWAGAATAGPLALYLDGFWAALPALVCGIIVGWYEGWRGKVTVFSGLMLGTGCGAVFYMLAEFLGWDSAVYGASFSVAVCAPVVVILAAITQALPGSARVETAP